jgi:hypothetical protein
MFGLEKIGQESVKDAQAAVNDIIVKLDPLLRDVENRAGGILESILDRLDGATITIHLKPIPKAEKVE